MNGKLTVGMPTPVSVITTRHLFPSVLAVIKHAPFRIRMHRQRFCRQVDEGLRKAASDQCLSGADRCPMELMVNVLSPE